MYTFKKWILCELYLNKAAIKNKNKMSLRTCSDFLSGSISVLVYQTKPFVVSSLTFREGNDTPLQYSCLENPKDGGAW